MKKELFLISTLSIVLLAGCGASTESITELEDIGKAIENGTSMICTIEASEENAPAIANMIYYIDGENIRVESEFNGEKMIAIQRGDESFVNPNSMMGETDCDWIVTSEEEEGVSDAPDFDYEQYQENPMYKMVCTKGKVDSAMFDTSGKKCTTDDLMQGVMNGMNLGGMDLGNIDISQFQ
ncbi:hypothetical protein JW758_05855 [Candidatus Peregrinibacteria bacterium]|nr:hypothetical protein [Candidatus Peregrinibacteria bacterium]